MLVTQPTPEQQAMMQQQAQIGAQGQPTMPEGGNQLGLKKQMSPTQSKPNASPGLRALV